MRICTWNVNSVRARYDHVHHMFLTENPHVLCLQETKTVDEDYPEFILDLGQYCTANGQKSYNGVSVHTWKNQHYDIEKNPLRVCNEARVLAFTYNNIRFINVYVPNGGKDENAYFGKLEWLGAFSVYLYEQLSKYKYLVVLGDFNICPSDLDVWNPRLWQDRVTCTQPERMAFQEMIDLGLTNVFDLFPINDYTWWNYRQGGYPKNQGLRIDHVLVSDALKPYVRSIEVLKKYREKEKPSDHAPVMVEIIK